MFSISWCLSCLYSCSGELTFDLIYYEEGLKQGQIYELRENFCREFVKTFPCHSKTFSVSSQVFVDRFMSSISRETKRLSFCARIIGL